MVAALPGAGIVCYSKLKMSAESDRSNYKLKVSLVSIVFAFVGLALLIVGKLVDRSDPSGLLGFLPMFEMG